MYTVKFTFFRLWRRRRLLDAGFVDSSQFRNSTMFVPTYKENKYNTDCFDGNGFIIQLKSVQCWFTSVEMEFIMISTINIFICRKKLYNKWYALHYALRLVWSCFVFLPRIKVAYQELFWGNKVKSDNVHRVSFHHKINSFRVIRDHSTVHFCWLPCWNLFCNINWLDVQYPLLNAQAVPVRLQCNLNSSYSMQFYTY